MGVYSIAQLENLSGVKAHTIRIWEQRYGLLKPSRTDTNIRFYTDDELRKLMNVSALLRQGMKISEVSRLTDDEIYQKLEEESGKRQGEDPFYDIYINKFIASAINFQESRFEKEFSFAVLRYGLEKVYIHILIPFLEKLGLLWGTNKITPVQEHFISNLIRQKIITAIDGLPYVEEERKKFLLFLPEDEDHEIGLLFASYLLRLHGLKVYYLGPRVPLENLIDAKKEIQVDYLMTFIPRIKPVGEFNSYLNHLTESNLSRERLVIAGNSWMLSKIERSDNILIMNDLIQFKDFCTSL